MTIVPIREGLEPPPSRGEVDEAVVAELEELLSRAQAGEIVGLAYVSLYPGDMTGFFAVGRITRSVIGTLEILKHDMCRGSVED